MSRPGGKTYTGPWGYAPRHIEQSLVFSPEERRTSQMNTRPHDALKAKIWENRKPTEMAVPASSVSPGDASDGCPSSARLRAGADERRGNRLNSRE